ncbi:MAG: hypothetical protein OEV60_10240 [Actinomycetota bacterium]|nr:hypothetical protein [Actinomycetota bacterium]MDH5313836.1 hypothetical protein [Actinomycetota bacterium]
MWRRSRWLTCALFGAIIATSSAPAIAVPGSRELITIDESFVVRGACRFPVRIEEEGQLGIRTHVDASGAVVFVAETPNIDTFFTNTKNGKSVHTRDVGLDKTVFEQDGTAWILSTGLHVRFVLPGGGLVFGRIGLQIITLDASGEFVSLEVIGGRFDDRDFRDFVCGTLT